MKIFYALRIMYEKFLEDSKRKKSLSNQSMSLMYIRLYIQISQMFYSRQASLKILQNSHEKTLDL